MVEGRGMGEIGGLRCSLINSYAHAQRPNGSVNVIPALDTRTASMILMTFICISLIHNDRMFLICANKINHPIGYPGPYEGFSSDSWRI
jgi:hypothetical protein